MTLWRTPPCPSLPAEEQEYVKEARETLRLLSSSGITMLEDFRDILAKAARETEEKNSEIKNRYERFKTRLQNDPESVTDVQIFEHIHELFWSRGAEPCDQEYDPLISSLSFTKADLQRRDTHELKQAWTGFLKRVFGLETSWEWPCSFGLAQWYLLHDKLSHAVAVYEHLYTQIRRMELAEYEDTYERCLLKLFDLCVEEGLAERARHVAELIGDYHDDGLISLDAYADVLLEKDSLRYREMGETIERDREEAKKNLHREIGSLFARLHDTTRKHVIEAELWSRGQPKGIDPIAAPLHWALAIESEFHHKIFSPNQEVLGNLLGEFRPKHGKTCGVGQISKLIEVTGSSPIRKAIVEKKISAWRNLVSVPDLVKILKEISKDRNRIAHVSSEGPYTKENSVEFVEHFRNSGWIFRFLSSLAVTG